MAEAEAVMVLVYAVPDFADMPQPVRAGWIAAIYPGVDVRQPQGAPPDDADDFTHREFVRRYLETEAIAVGAVFTSEAYGPGFAAYLGVPHRSVDPARTRVPVSGTMIRTDPGRWRDYLDPLVFAALTGRR